MEQVPLRGKPEGPANLPKPEVGINLDDPVIQFENIPALIQEIRSSRKDILYVTGVIPFDFERLVAAEEQSEFPKIHVSRFCYKKRLLIIIIPTLGHEALHSKLWSKFVIQQAQMGLDDHWEDLGSGRFRVPHGHQSGNGGDAGEGDSSGCPRITPKRDWPTLVFEAGYCQSLDSLRAKMRWWFRCSNHQVKIVVLIKYNSAQSRITLEKWQEELTLPTQQGPITRSHALAVPVPTPQCNQEIFINKNTSTSPATFDVIRAPLVLDFRQVFLRDPIAGETDFTFNEGTLQRYAEVVWDRLE
ncbi:hypothetical protein QBC42DRAFT_313065 [Cladorrhinum samala]|uniref:Uncharacterized protein n=1 Tax=Cladorrhinum samala TaxID=585594 RepID=A0AAV9HET9_9PEZI|nr:hypothetical protein QBC42DRAFT_313065 [Cladorrhinum samala]